jgi:hypothetical protein
MGHRVTTYVTSLDRLAVWDNPDMPTANQPIVSSTDREPSLDELFGEVKLVRSRGVGDRSNPLIDRKGLLHIARIISDEADEEQKIVDALRRAVGRLGGHAIPALEALFGLTKETQGLDVKPRRAIAAARYNFTGVETFRTRKENTLLMAVANNLQVLAAERRLAERDTGPASGPAHNGLDPESPASIDAAFEEVLRHTALNAKRRRAERPQEPRPSPFEPGWQISRHGTFGFQSGIYEVRFGLRELDDRRDRFSRRSMFKFGLGLVTVISLVAVGLLVACLVGAVEIVSWLISAL